MEKQKTHLTEHQTLLLEMVEPIYIANPYIYYFFLMIQGGINGAMHQSKSEVTP